MKWVKPQKTGQRPVFSAATTGRWPVVYGGTFWCNGFKGRKGLRGW